MGNKINLVEILKDCPPGMELDCVMYDNCTFDGIDDVGYTEILVKTPSGQIRLTKDGCFTHHDEYAKCVIFPKGKTTWDGFVPPCKFKVGDNIRIKDTLAIYVVTEIREDCYMLDDKDIYLLFKNQDLWEQVPDKFDINTLKPFDKVLVRHDIDNKWNASLFSFIDKDFNSYCYKFVTIAGKSYPMMIPYEGNEHLLGTKDDCKEFYKTWK